MKELSVREYKKMTWDILVCIAEYLERHNLRYVLFYGTLLGAVRHQGFIPWDDDIDIAMPRPDYEEFRKLLKTEPLAPYYIPASVHDGNSVYPWMYIIDTRTKIENDELAMEENLFVDVFPLDGMPKDEAAAKKRKEKGRRLHKNHVRSRYPYKRDAGTLRGILKFPLLYWAHKTGPAKFAEQMEKLAKEVPYEEGTECAVMTYFPDESEVFAKKDLFPAKKIGFEGREFCAPNNADKVLRTMFGNYWELPPKEKQVGYIHKAYLLDEGE